MKNADDQDTAFPRASTWTTPLLPPPSTINSLAQDAAGVVYMGGSTAQGGHISAWPSMAAPAWVKSIPGSVEVLAVQPSGGVLVACGTFIGVTDFGRGQRTSLAYPRVVAKNIWMASYAPGGQCLWDLVLGTGYNSYAASIAPVGGQHVIVTGRVAGGTSDSQGTYWNAQNGDVYLLRIDAITGAKAWLNIFPGGNSPGLGASVALSAGESEGHYVGGSFQGTHDFRKGSPTNPAPLTSRGVNDGFLLKFTRNGTRTGWVAQLGSTGDEAVQAVAIHPTKNLIAIGGHFSNTVDFGSGLSLTSVKDWDAFVAFYDLDGACLGVTQIGGTGSVKEVRALAWDHDVLVAAGDFQGELTTPLRATAVGTWDAFVVRFESRQAISLYTDGTPNGASIAQAASGPYVAGHRNTPQGAQATLWGV